MPRLEDFRHDISAALSKPRIMGRYFFKTNINCIGCASQIKPHLDQLEQSHEIEHWQVHLQDPEHILEIETNKMSPEQVTDYIRSAGFQAEVASKENHRR